MTEIPLAFIRKRALISRFLFPVHELRPPSSSRSSTKFDPPLLTPEAHSGVLEVSCSICEFVLSCREG
ncbi:hypothetical protein Syun_012095 [Stephania yunnanensis]|uniref:Uncharacterized protein n=1 Tax=Stephania yunnanensis TaxID=152371 RepID=A0AAP0K125_9MAGN